MGIVSLSSRCSPIRISASGKETMTVTVTARNNSEQPQLLSVELALPGALSIDETGIANTKSARLGELAPGASTDASFEVHATHRTAPNDYSARITCFVHYRNYNSVMEKSSVETTIRVVE